MDEAFLTTRATLRRANIYVSALDPGRRTRRRRRKTCSDVREKTSVGFWAKKMELSTQVCDAHRNNGLAKNCLKQGPPTTKRYTCRKQYEIDIDGVLYR
jgi:hypothetical protein